MSRVTLGLMTVSFLGIAAASPAMAGCCGWGSGCCTTSYVAYPAPVYVQPAAPVVVQAPPQQIIVQVPQPQVIVQQPQPEVYVQPVPSYVVNQGPVYTGIDTVGYSPSVYYADRPVRAYPYVSYHKPYRHYRPDGYRAWRYGYRAWKHRHHRVYKAYPPHRYSGYRAPAPYRYKKTWH
ncbi:MAG: hypothetical protein F9K38_10815 [Pseudorhodoplanes sp.]|nr:MAG: hypothetical protein F9K38_10815 [Pseudorhodoplanes sp.]